MGIDKEAIPKGFTKYEWYIGIDPGVTTGYAIFNSKKNEFMMVTSGKILEAMLDIQERFQNNINGHSHLIRIEDARKRGNSGAKSAAKAQGAGSVKRDSKIWEEWCEMHGYNYELVAPQRNMTKLDQKTFKQITGWEKQTNHNSRDSAMLIYGL